MVTVQGHCMGMEKDTNIVFPCSVTLCCVVMSPKLTRQCTLANKKRDG